MHHKFKIKIFFLFLVIITTQSILNSIFTFPKGDQTNFLYAADQLFNGGKLGLDVWEVKPPLHLFLICFFYIFHKSLIAVHIGELFLNLSAIYIFYKFSKDKLSKETTAYISIFYLFFYYFGTPSYERFQVEGLFNPILIISISLLFSNKKILYLISGIFFSFFAFSKILGIFFLLLIFYFFKRSILIFSSGFILGLIVIFLSFSFFGSINNIIEDLKLTIFFRDYSSQINLKNIILENFFGNIFFSIFFIIKISFVLIFFIIINSDKYFSQVKFKYIKNCIIILLPPFLCVFLQSKFYLYHFYYFLPCCAFIYGFMVSNFYSLNSGFLKNPLIKIMVIIPIFFFQTSVLFFAQKIDTRVSKFENRFSFSTNIYSFFIETKYFYSFILKNNSLSNYRAIIFENMDTNLDTIYNLDKNTELLKNKKNFKINKILQLANHVKKNTKKNESVLYLVNGYFPYLIERKSHNKYFAPHPFKKIYKNDKKFGENYKIITKNFEKSLASYEGKFIVVSNWFPLDKVNILKMKIKENYKLNEYSFIYGKEEFFLYEKLN